MSRGRILFVVGSLCVGGAEKQTITLANGIDASGFEAGVCYLNPQSDLRSHLAENVDRNSWCLDKKSGLDFAVLRGLRRAILERRPDVLVCVNTYPLLVTDLVLRTVSSRPRLVNVLHATILPAGAHEWSVRFWLRSVINRRCDAVVFISEDQRHYWRKRYGIRADVGTVIRNGIDTEHYQARMTPGVRLAERARWGFSPADVVVGCCAAMREEKRHTDLLEALRALVGRGLPVKALLIGDGPERRRVEHWVQTHDFGNSCGITGFQADVRPMLEACDVVALSSITEGSPLSLIEAMALGKPVVAPAVGGIPEMIVPGVNGHTYAVGNVAALAEAIGRTIEGDRAGAMGEAARRIACERFSERAMNEAYAGLFDALMGAA